jgi:hypothetical protein
MLKLYNSPKTFIKDANCIFLWCMTNLLLVFVATESEYTKRTLVQDCLKFMYTLALRLII